MKLVAIDLGKIKAGVAVFDEQGALLGARTVRIEAKTDVYVPEDMAVAMVEAARGLGGVERMQFIVEKPQKYKDKRNRHKDLDDLLAVEKMLRLACRRAKVPFKALRPAAWKGQVPKHIHATRIRALLTEEEGKKMPEEHDAVDAVGIGLFVLKRAGLGGVPIAASRLR